MSQRMPLERMYDYRRMLPHHQKAGRALFVTFCKLLPTPFTSDARDAILQHCLHDVGPNIRVTIAGSGSSKTQDKASPVWVGHSCPTPLILVLVLILSCLSPNPWQKSPSSYLLQALSDKSVRPTRALLVRHNHNSGGIRCNDHGVA